MSKLIIDNRSETLLDKDACQLVMQVIEGGRISNHNNQYTYLTIFVFNGKEYGVSTDLNKKSDKFIIYDRP